jgi:hypothetical protein
LIDRQRHTHFFFAEGERDERLASIVQLDWEKIKFPYFSFGFTDMHLLRKERGIEGDKKER